MPDQIRPSYSLPSSLPVSLQFLPVSFPHPPTSRATERGDGEKERTAHLGRASSTVFPLPCKAFAIGFRASASDTRSDLTLTHLDECYTQTTHEKHQNLHLLETRRSDLLETTLIGTRSPWTHSIMITSSDSLSGSFEEDPP
eukprot:3933401-Rhodomonas_salina.1